MTSQTSKKNSLFQAPASSHNSSLSETHIPMLNARLLCTLVIIQDAESSSRSLRVSLTTSESILVRSPLYALLKGASKASIKLLIKRSISILTKEVPTLDAESVELKSPRSNLLSTTKIVSQVENLKFRLLTRSDSVERFQPTRAVMQARSLSFTKRIKLSPWQDNPRKQMHLAAQIILQS